MTMTDYQTPVNEFLKSAGVTMTVRLVGDDCPMFCTDAGKYPEEIGKFPRKHHIHGQHWLVRFTRGEHTVKSPKKEYSVDFWDSYHDAEYRWVSRPNPGPDRWQIPDELIRKHGGNPDASFAVFPKREKREPTAYDVLSAITQNEPGTFKDWFFSAEELETLREIAV